MDYSKFKKLTIGGVELKQLFINGVQVWKSGYKNRVKYSTEADGVTIYNGGLGYKNGYRIRSGGAEGSAVQGSCTGFIPVNGEDIIRLSGWDFSTEKNENAINVSDSSFTNIGQFTMLAGAGYGIFAYDGAYKEFDKKSVVKESENVWKWAVPPSASGVAYIRVSGYTNPTNNNTYKNMIITINEEIT